METNEKKISSLEAIKKLEEDAKKENCFKHYEEVKGEDYFEIGGQKFSCNVTLEEAIKVLGDKNCKDIFQGMKKPFVEKVDEELMIVDAQDLIDSIDTKIKTPRFEK